MAITEFDPAQFIATVGTFLVAFFLLKKFMFLPLIAMVEERQAKIQEDIRTARSDREDMARLKTEHEQQIRSAEKKIQEMMREATHSAEKIGGEIVQQARDQAKAILDKTQVQLSEERDRVMKSMREEVVGLAIQVAEQVVKKNLDKDSHKDAAKRFAQELVKS